MPISDYILYRLAKRWPSPASAMVQRLGAQPGTDAYHAAYSQVQFDEKVEIGLQLSVMDLEVLEIGCGHGGISCFLAVAGARRVIGIDLDPMRLQHAENFLATVNRRLGNGCALPVTFREESALQLNFPDASFDLVMADKVFEHFADPEAVLKEVYRVLRPGGRVLIPVFTSIYSKHGLHLKHGLKMPWANIYFSETTIIRAMHRLAAENPQIAELYPGLADQPHRVRDLRRYGDLNGITYRQFLRMADRAEFEIDWFRPEPTRFGRLLRFVPVLKSSILRDIFSKGAGACLRKPSSAAAHRKADQRG